MDIFDSNREVTKIIALCDGNFDAGQPNVERSNISKMRNCFQLVDHNSGCRQLIHYVSVGRCPSSLDHYCHNTFVNAAASAYALLASNYVPGDEIYLFGFSAGAYVARMVADIIGKIGMLGAAESISVVDIIVKYYQSLNSKDAEERKKMQEEVAPYLRRDSPGNKRLAASGYPFSIQCLGLFESVGSMGVVDEPGIMSNEDREMFTVDKKLGDHIQRVFHAVALNETRPSYECNLLEQTLEGKRKGQVLEQCWFAGNHSDVGGSYSNHELGDLALVWMLGNVEFILGLNYKYLYKQMDPERPWGSLKPHRSGAIQDSRQSKGRTFPTEPSSITNQIIHESVLEQEYIHPELAAFLAQHKKEVIKPLLHLEKWVKSDWAEHLEKKAEDQ